MLPASFSGFSGLIASLYYVCCLLLAGLALFVASQQNQRTPKRLRCAFVLLALSLLTWQATLFLEVRTTLPVVQLGLGRVNFASVVFVTTFALRFVQELPDGASTKPRVLSGWLLAETGLLAALTLLTPLVDAAERVEAGHAISTYGVLFPGYLLHVVATLIAAVALAFRKSCRAGKQVTRRQLALIGIGMLMTGSVAVLTNALLPYAFDAFQYCDLGTLSVFCFVLAVAYATFIHGLFHSRVILRETLVYGLLLAFVLGAYSSAALLVTQLTSKTDKPTQFAVLMIAFSLDPLRRFLEKKTDRWLAARHGAQRSAKRPARASGGKEASGSRGGR